MTADHHHDHRHDHRLDGLENRLRSARSRRSPQEPNHRKSPVWGPAARVAIDFVAALVVGVVIGLMIDYWLGFGPWGLIVFFILGAAAGMMNVYRIAAGHDMAVGYRSELDHPRGLEKTEPKTIIKKNFQKSDKNADNSDSMDHRISRFDNNRRNNRRLKK